MDLSCLYILMLICTLVAGAPKKSDKRAKDKFNSDQNEEHIAALYVKDNDNGELRFLTGSSGTLNQFITQKQNLLEQLRPTTGLGTGSYLTGTGSLTSGTGLFTGTGTSNSNGVTPIIVSLGGNNANTNTGSLASVAAAASPIADLLPQIVANGVLGGTQIRRGNQNRRRIGNRRNGNRRRRRPSNKGGVYVVRPKN